MKFVIEQIAIVPHNPQAAMRLLTAMGAAEWVTDHVVASGLVDSAPGRNEADLNFNYQMGAVTEPDGSAPALEFEVLNYTSGPNWMRGRPNSVSHLGMHCSEEDLVKWRAFFKDRGIVVAQEVLTESHSNPHIAGKRWYNYVIFSTRAILGVDLKFIVRKDHPPIKD